ncbi:UNVERIFIED_CONTAM: putative membrane-anchored protein [Brevibacillus sp. OAP136]
MKAKEPAHALGYAKGSLILISILLAVLAVWFASDRSLNVNYINSRKVEIFYWTAILFSNTLGTALGDFLADDSGLGFAGGAMLIGGLLALIVLAAYYTKVSRVFLFWLAFVLTRPFGATFGDFLTKPHAKGGLELGTIGSSLVLVILLIVCIIYTTRKNGAVKANQVSTPL